MEDELNKWEGLWQQQKASDIDIDKLTCRLIKLERITKFQRLLLLLVSVFTIYSMYTHLTLNSYNVTAALIILTGLLILLIPLLKKKSDINNINNYQFVENHIQYLKKKLLIPKVYFLIFITLFILALNIAFIGALKNTYWTYKMLFHFSTIILFIVLLIVRKVGIKNYNHEILPLIKKLKNINK
ncbi:MAG: hypothetical protein R3342_03855 [Lutibacter sp.]|uniref:hypothetical protein n=1 Tax=Lutibacter sp. TaxID=1925666 RepID=UPI00299D8392|nr:hypothetical protein [Lutibacter sp.]MDX1828662.1 hypothetical protein [Lutibacter sp.]